MNPNYWLALSSLTFLAPAIVSYNTNNYTLSYLYFILVPVSSAYHATKYQYLQLLDYTIAHSAHLLGIYTIIPGGWTAFYYYWLWFSYNFTIYYYGYITKTMIWNPDLNAATPWHMSFHISSSIMLSHMLLITHYTKQIEDLQSTTS
jgi:hypothetical protein